MADKPAQICQLEADKLIDVQRGFVSTFNWLASALSHLKGGEHCEIDWTIPDHPIINVTLDDSEGGSSGGGDVQMIGTDGSTYTGPVFTFASASNANVRVHITDSGEIQLGAYYV